MNANESVVPGLVRETIRHPLRFLRRSVSWRWGRKVFAIGFNKTGTTSLDATFTELGYLSYHGTGWRKTARRKYYFFFDAFSDGVPDDFRKLAKDFPRAKFILNVRSLDEWLSSRLKHVRRLPRESKNPNWRATPEAVRSWICEWNEYHVEVFEHFRDRPEDLLIVNYVRDPLAADRIADFLGSKNRNLSRSHANKAAQKSLDPELSKLISNALAEMGIPEREARNDMHCPSYSRIDASMIPSDTSLIYPDPGSNAELMPRAADPVSQ